MMSEKRSLRVNGGSVRREPSRGAEPGGATRLLQTPRPGPAGGGEAEVMMEITEKQAEREEEAVSLLSREPDVGLDPRTLRP
uniref:Uncharacterized protein n=1 Tax=Mustela putorius furo TaxID=9669 RepID=M3YMZ3_MUSPF